jgi:hypothetical protein
MREDAKVGRGHRKDFEKFAVVTDATWIRDGVSLLRVLTPCSVKLFPNDQLAEAKAWLVAPRAHPGVALAQ